MSEYYCGSLFVFLITIAIHELQGRSLWWYPITIKNVEKNQKIAKSVKNPKISKVCIKIWRNMYHFLNSVLLRKNPLCWQPCLSTDTSIDTIDTLQSIDTISIPIFFHSSHHYFEQKDRRKRNDLCMKFGALSYLGHSACDKNRFYHSGQMVKSRAISSERKIRNFEFSSKPANSWCLRCLHQQ